MSNEADDLLSQSNEAILGALAALVVAMVSVIYHQHYFVLAVWLASVLLYSFLNRSILAAVVILHFTMAWLHTDAFFVKVLFLLLLSQRWLVTNRLTASFALPLLPVAILLFVKMEGMWQVWLLTLLSMGVATPLIVQRNVYSVYAWVLYSLMVVGSYFFFPQLDILFLLVMLLLLFTIGQKQTRWFWMACTLLLVVYSLLSSGA